MRRLIRADIRRILKKPSVMILFCIALAFLGFHVIGSFLAYEKDPVVPVKDLISHMGMPELVIGLVILFGVYSDDFRSMSYSSVIGRGLTRSKLVLAKLLDTVILAALISPIANTGIFIIGMLLFFRETLAAWANGSDLLTFIIIGLTGVNFLVELGVNIVLSPVVVKIIDAVKKTGKA